MQAEPAVSRMVAGYPRGGRELDVRVAELVGHADHEACVRLQRRVWGSDYQDSVPGSLLQVSQKVGGLVAGAFVGSGELIGFVFGLTGVREGRLVHWSHMLAVDPSYRDRGVGRRLKLYQRERLRSFGVERMYWSFDPLVARNAHLNVNRLGVVVEDYVTEMYSDTGSDLHTFGTDRFVASWPVDAAAAVASRAAVPGHSVPSRVESGADVGMSTERLVSAMDEPAAPIWDSAASSSAYLTASAVRVEVPADAEAMRNGDLERLREWRLQTRQAFTTLYGLGWRVAGFQRELDRCFYVVTRPDG